MYNCRIVIFMFRYQHENKPRVLLSLLTKGNRERIRHQIHICALFHYNGSETLYIEMYFCAEFTLNEKRTVLSKRHIPASLKEPFQLVNFASRQANNTYRMIAFTSEMNLCPRIPTNIHRPILYNLLSMAINRISNIWYHELRQVLVRLIRNMMTMREKVDIVHLIISPIAIIST